MIDFYKDLKKYMKEYGADAVRAYERGLITLQECIRIAHEKELQELQEGSARK